MGALLERVKLSNSLYGKNIVDSFKNNSMYFYEGYTKSDKLITNIPVGKMQLGGFYHLHYRDDSNWMKYSPIFTADFKKFGNMIIIIGINFNFIPIEVRSAVFDKYMVDDDFEKDRLLPVDYKSVYNELLSYGFEYALVEYNLGQVELVHKINTEVVPRFLYSGHPINKYDPKKLYEIWKAKISTKRERDQEMSSALISDFYEASGSFR